MRDEVLALFRELADLSSDARARYFEEHDVDSEVRAEAVYDFSNGFEIGLAGQEVRIEGKAVGASVEGLTVNIGGAVFTGAGLLVVIAIIAILIAL